MTTPDGSIVAVDEARRGDEGRRPSFRERLGRWFTTGGLLLAALVLVIAAVGIDLFGPAPPIVVSPRTTWITSPLAEDGLPDYPRFLLEAHGPAPDAAENAAVPLLAALWPMGMREADARFVCEAIGTAPAPVAMSLGLTPRDFPGGSDDAASVPWRGDDLPLLRDWLDVHRPAIDLVVEAADRPRLWLPAPALLRGDPWLVLHTMPPPHLERLTVAARVLALRAMRDAGEGRFDDAWRSTLAIHRLARLAASSSGGATGVFDLFTARNVALIADDCTLALVACDALPDATLASLRRDLAALPPLPSLRSCLTVERVVALDTVLGFSRAHGRSIPLTEILSPRGPHLFFVRTSLDWNAILEGINETFDRADEAAGRASYADRVKALRDVQRSLVSSWRGPYPPSVMHDARAVAGLVFVGRRERTRAVGQMICADVFGAYDVLEGIAAESACRLDVALVAAALETARRTHPGRAYPRRLEDLVPDVLASVPLDRFTDTPLVYERRGDGYLLYSVGKNGTDDLGTAGPFGRAAGWIVEGEWQETHKDPPDGDIVVRMPMPMPVRLLEQP